MKTIDRQVSIAWKIGFTAMLCAVIAMLPDFAFAQVPNTYGITATDTDMGNVICAAAGFFVGNAGKGIATIGICIIGAAACFGKASWGMTIVVAVGISILFGSGAIIQGLQVNAFGC